MTPEYASGIARRAYQYMAPWSAKQIADTLAGPNALFMSTDHAFVLGQVVADEAEVFALASDPDHQRQGLASTVLANFLDEAARKGAVKVFLEVAAHNKPAIAFYERQGFSKTGRRKAYYPQPDGSHADALLMSRDLP